LSCSTNTARAAPTQARCRSPQSRRTGRGIAPRHSWPKDMNNDSRVRSEVGRTCQHRLNRIPSLLHIIRTHFLWISTENRIL
jgi:hypothetical protein